ncbi:MAG: NAD kinase [Bacteroidota bacterium]
MRRIAIHGREVSEEVEPYVLEVISVLRDHDVEIFVSDSFCATKYRHLFQGVPRFTEVKDRDEYDAFLSLGGDGTFLETLTYVGATEIPVLGINMGRLGFLAHISREDIRPALSRLFSDQFSCEARSMVSLESSEKLFDKSFGLNEIAILRKDTSSMISVKAYINENYLATYWADGLMVSTPTGSTGYSLSCGGPIVMPESGNFIITPVSPHNLNVRPLVLSDDCTLRFEVDSRGANFLVSLDSRSAATHDGIELFVKKAPFKAKMIRIEGYGFIETLRAKLSWGLDRRN